MSRTLTMKHITILLAFLMTLSTQAGADILNGKMDCKVKTNRITVVSDGIGTEYPAFKDAFVVGDTLRFSYGYFLNKSTISMRDINRNFDVWKMEIAHSEGYDNRIVSNNTETGAGIQRENSDENFFHPDHIRSEGTHMVDNRILDGKISLNRYYKNDWDGLVYYKETFGALHVFTIDCRHIIDNLDSVIVALLDDKSKLEQ